MNAGAYAHTTTRNVTETERLIYVLAIAGKPVEQHELGIGTERALQILVDEGKIDFTVSGGYYLLLAGEEYARLRGWLPEEAPAPKVTQLPAKQQQSIRNADKWVGKHVHHMANWRDFKWLKGADDNATDDYFVDEWTGKLWRACDQAGWYGTFETYEEAVAAGYDECYYYSEDGLYQMWLAAKVASKSSLRRFDK